MPDFITSLLGLLQRLLLKGIGSYEFISSANAACRINEGDYILKRKEYEKKSLSNRVSIV